MVAGQALLVVAVERDVELVLGSHLLEETFDVVHAADLSHGLGGVVGVTASAVPVLEELGLEADRDGEVLSNATEEIPGDPKLVTDLNAEAGADLVLPLAGHDLVVGAGDLDTSEEAGLVVGVHDSATVADVGTHRAVVGTLRSWETISGPPERPNSELVLDLQQTVLLLNPEPWLLKHTRVEDLLGEVSEVGVGRLECGEALVSPDEGLSQDDDVVATAEGVGVVSDGLHDNF